MSDSRAMAELKGHRGELMVELFLRELEPAFLSRAPNGKVGYDLLVGFRNALSGINTFAVEVKSTEDPVGPTFPLPAAEAARLAHSNVPALLVVADVRRNHLYVGRVAAADAPVRRRTVRIPVEAIDNAGRHRLRERLTTVPAEAAVAG